MVSCTGYLWSSKLVYTLCLKLARFRSFSGPYFLTFRLNMERYEVPLCIQSKCGKIWARKTLNMDTFHAVLEAVLIWTSGPSFKKQKESFYFFHDEGPYNIETSLLICSAYQWASFYMIGTSVTKELKTQKTKKQWSKRIYIHTI